MTLWHILTDDEREALVLKAVAELATSQVPPHLREGLVRYLSDGILPGSFMQAVLCNDLQAALARVAPNGLASLPALVEFLRWTVPIEAWGSREKVLAWTTTPNRLEV